MISDQIDKWIERQLADGKDPQELDETHFVGKEFVATIKVTKKGKFNLNVKFTKVVMLEVTQ